MKPDFVRGLAFTHIRQGVHPDEEGAGRRLEPENRRGVACGDCRQHLSREQPALEHIAESGPARSRAG